jgi:hypothetical protein
MHVNASIRFSAFDGEVRARPVFAERVPMTVVADIAMILANLLVLFSLASLSRSPALRPARVLTQRRMPGD